MVGASLECGLHRDRLRAGVLDVDLEVVLEVLPDAGQVRDHGHVERLELGRGADAGELQDWGVSTAPPQRMTLPPRTSRAGQVPWS